MKFNEYELIYLIREGSEEASLMLQRLYEPFIGKIAKRYYVKGAEYEDFFQVGLDAFFRSIYSYDELMNVSFYSYCMICSRNAMNSLSREAARKSRVEVAYQKEFDEYSFVQENLDCSYVTLENRIHQRSIIAMCLSPEVSILSNLEKRCLKKLIEGYNYSEIATTLSLSEKVVGNAMLRCKRKLRDVATTV